MSFIPKKNYSIMPYKPKKSKSVVRHGNKSFRLPLLRTVMPHSIVPARFVATLPYVEFFTLDSTSGVPAYYLFAANSCYDPDQTSTGHQPRGFDQYMAMYQYGRVIKSDISVKAVIQAGVSVPSLLSIDCTTQSGIKSISTQNENGTSVQTTMSTPAGGKDAAVLNHRFNANWKTPKEDLSNLRFTASADANTLQWFHIQLAPIVTAAQIKADCFVKINYMIEFYDPKVPSAS